MTPTELCNVALGHIGQARIADIGERSPAAEHCRRMFDHTRRACLRDHDWNFAVRRSALTALDAAPPFGYSVAYQLPTDCLRVLSINGQPAGVRGANWEVEGRTILCNASYAHLRYIADATDSEQWDDMFGAYFCYRLAAAIAPSLRLDPQAGMQLEQMAAALRASAQEADRVETAPMVTRLDQSEIIQERGGWASGTAYGTDTGNTSASTIGWGRIAVTGQDTVAAAIAGDTFTLVAGSNVTLTTNAATKTITIAATGGGGGAVNLTPSRTANAVTITPSGGGSAAEIPQANATHAGVMTADQHNKLNDLPTASQLTTSLDGKAAASHTHTASQISDSTVAGRALLTAADATAQRTALELGTLATQTGTFSGTSSGTNTGDQTITLTGDVTGSGTGLFATTLANSGVTAGSYIRATITVDSKGRVTSATSNTAGEINGSAGTVDNAIIRADGTGGSAVQGSSIVIDDASTATSNNVAIAVNHAGQTNSSLVLTPQGTGAFIVGQKPDGTISGGNSRGARSVDLQLSRTAATQVALGVNSFIAGGTGHTITSGGTESAVIGGANNSASAQNSAVLGGNNNSASGPRSVCLGGNNNNASGGQATAIGTFNTASAITTLAIGQSAVANRFAMLAHSAGNFSSSGDAQVGTMVARNQTSSATITDLFLNGTSDRVTLLSNQSMMVDVFFVARSAGGVDEACFHRRCLIVRDAGVATTAIVGSVQTVGTDIATAGASAWAVTVSADTTNGALRLQVTGAAATNINWVAKISTLEVIRA